MLLIMQVFPRPQRYLHLLQCCSKWTAAQRRIHERPALQLLRCRHFCMRLHSRAV